MAEIQAQKIFFEVWGGEKPEKKLFSSGFSAACRGKGGGRANNPLFFGGSSRNVERVWRAIYHTSSAILLDKRPKSRRKKIFLEVWGREESEKNFFTLGFGPFVGGGESENLLLSTYFFSSSSRSGKRWQKTRKCTSLAVSPLMGSQIQAKKFFFGFLSSPPSSQNPKKFFCAWIWLFVEGGGKARAPIF